ncbi:hypothetical protein QJS10_CPB15g00341 [Acorus calamus]|uniref:Uncharacterized protein n=1 Tax=Acorus calamus TaxID=4465 RepID=A0AAV9D6Q6_ACOCL|nr:hypothetical protein QJS10_CPB15g00341 [Acorus calamus]
MIIYTCCNSRGRLVELCGDLGLPIVFDIIKTASKDGFREDWLPLLLSKICLEESCFPLLFDKLSSVDKFTSEQTFLVRLLAENLDQRFNEVIVSDAFASAVLSILYRASMDVNFTSRGTSALPTGDPAIDVLGYSLITLRNICAREDPPHPSIDSLISLGLVRLLLVLLRDLEPPTNVRTILKNSNVMMKACPYRGFRRDVVAVLGNCAFRRKECKMRSEMRMGSFLCCNSVACVMRIHFRGSGRYGQCRMFWKGMKTMRGKCPSLSFRVQLIILGSLSWV